MLTQEDNERLTRVGPGTLMGKLLRWYWHPIAADAMLHENPVRKVRILGEDLVLYRDRSSNLGLVHDHCAHRSTGLQFGIPDVDGLRCAYHGWKYDATGQCIDTPLEPPGSTFKGKDQDQELPGPRDGRPDLGVPRRDARAAAAAVGYLRAAQHVPAHRWHDAPLQLAPVPRERRRSQPRHIPARPLLPVRPRARPRAREAGQSRGPRFSGERVAHDGSGARLGRHYHRRDASRVPGDTDRALRARPAEVHAPPPSGEGRRGEGVERAHRRCLPVHAARADRRAHRRYPHLAHRVPDVHARPRASRRRNRTSSPTSSRRGGTRTGSRTSATSPRRTSWAGGRKERLPTGRRSTSGTATPGSSACGTSSRSNSRSSRTAASR